MYALATVRKHLRRHWGLIKGLSKRGDRVWDMIHCIFLEDVRTVEDLASRVARTPRAVRRLFRLSGVPEPLRWIQLNKLLCTSQSMIGRRVLVAKAFKETHYANQFAFSNALKRECGISPIQLKYVDNVDELLNLWDVLHEKDE